MVTWAHTCQARSMDAKSRVWKEKKRSCCTCSHSFTRVDDDVSWWNGMESFDGLTKKSWLLLFRLKLSLSLTRFDQLITNTIWQEEREREKRIKNFRPTQLHSTPLDADSLALIKLFIQNFQHFVRSFVPFDGRLIGTANIWLILDRCCSWIKERKRFLAFPFLSRPNEDKMAEEEVCLSEIQRRAMTRQDGEQNTLVNAKWNKWKSRWLPKRTDITAPRGFN